MKFFKKLKTKFKAKKTQKLPTVFLNKSPNKNSLSKKKSLEKIAKRNFKRNAPINLLGKITKISRWIWLAIFLAIFLLTCYISFFTTTFQINKILIFEGETESTNLQIRRTTEPLRNRNIFLFNEEELKQSITNRIDNLTNITVERQLPKTVIIRYEKYKDVANINNLIGRAKVRKTFVINENGTLTEENKISSTLPNITIESEKAYNLGEKITDKETMTYIIESKNYFEEKFNLKIIDTKYLPIAKEIRLVTEKNSEIWLDLGLSYKEQLTKLKNAIPKINLYEGPLEYVDLRIQSAQGQKIIYR